MAGLTGNSFFLDQAGEYFNQAINEAERGSSAWAVAAMEGEIAQRQQRKKIDWEVFSSAYQTAVKLSP
jgi:hypothetical protein